MLLNAALAIQLYNPHLSVNESLKDAAKSIDSGYALNVVRLLQEKFPLNAS